MSVDELKEILGIGKKTKTTMEELRGVFDGNDARISSLRAAYEKMFSCAEVSRKTFGRRGGKGGKSGRACAGMRQDCAIMRQ